MYKVTRKTTMPKTLKNTTYDTYDKAKYSVRKYLKATGKSINLNENGFSVTKAQ